MKKGGKRGTQYIFPNFFDRFFLQPEQLYGGEKEGNSGKANVMN
jgi:hypothetical protein